MKTINFLHILKYPVLLLIAVFGLFIGGSENVPNQLPKPRTVDIGGQGAPRIPSLLTESHSAPLNYADNSLDIGGQSVPRSGYLVNNGKHLLASLGTDSPIGNLGAPRLPISRVSSDFKPLRSECFAIGGQSAPRTLATGGSDIVGGQTAPRTFAHVECHDFLPIEIKPIGGSQSVPRMFVLNGKTTSDLSSFRWSLSDIGGNGSQLPKPTFPLQPIGGPGNPPRA